MSAPVPFRTSPAWLLLGLYAALTLLVFAPFFLHGKTLLDSSRLDLDPTHRHLTGSPGNADSATIHLAVVTAFHRSLAEGRLSIWDPGHLCGISGMADTIFHPFYPPVLIAYALFDAPTAYMLLIIVHFWFAGFAAHLFARKLGCGLAACVTAALVWLLSNFQAVWSPVNGTFAAVWVPLSMTAILSVRPGCILRPLAAAAVCTGLVVLSSIAQVGLYFSLLACTWLTLQLRGLGLPWLRSAAATALFGSIAMLWSAPEWIPRSQMIADSALARTVSVADPVEQATFKGPSAPPTMPRTLAVSKLLRGYFGMLPMLVVFLTLRSLWHRREGRMLLVTMGIGLIMSLAFYGALYAGWTTFVHSLFSPRWMILYAFAACGLSAMAVEQLLRRIRENLWDGLLPAIISLAAAGILGGTVFWTNSQGPDIGDFPSFGLWQIKTMLIAASLAAGLTALLFVTAAHIPRLSAFAVVVIVLGDLFVHRSAAAPFAPSPKLQSAHPAIDLVRRMVAEEGPYRSAGYVRLRSAPEGNVFGIYGLESPSGLQPFIPARFYLYASLAGAYVSRSRDIWVDPQVLASSKARLFNVRYIILPEEERVPAHLTLKPLATLCGTTVYEMQGALPRAFVPARARRIPPQAILNRMQESDFDPSEELLLEGPEQHFRQGNAGVHVLRYTGDTMTLRVQAESNAFLLICTSYDPGWRASVDGVPATVERADYAFMAVRVPAGTHELYLWHWPRGLTLGLLLAAAGLVYATLLALLPRFSAEKS